MGGARQMRSNRRDFIKLGVAGSAALSALGGSVALSGRGPTPPATGFTRLRPADVELVRAMVPCVLRGSVDAADNAAIDPTLGSLDQTLDDLSEQVVASVQQALDLISMALTRGLVTGHGSSWEGASVADAQGALSRLRDSDTEIFNAIYAALTRLVISAWYALPQGQAATGYPGPPRKVPGAVALPARGALDAGAAAGTVELGAGGFPVLDHPVNDHVLQGVRRAWKVMAEMQFATGARSVRPAHSQARQHTSLKEAKAEIGALALAPHKATVGSAHVMGGCPMGDDPQRSVTDSDGKFHHLSDLYVMDGSLLPTSIGANPRLSIYGLAHKLADGLARQAAPKDL